MQICIEKFGVSSTGRPCSLYRLETARGAFVELTEYGATVTRLAVPDRNGVLKDVVLGKDTLEEYEKSSFYNGSVNGRIANRVVGGRFAVNGTEYQLEVRRDGDSMHCGSANYARRRFECLQACAKDDRAEVTFFLRDEGSGGLQIPLSLWVTYSFSEQTCLQIRYRTLPEAATPVALTSHCYFNLAGEGEEDISGQLLQLNADFCTPPPQCGSVGRGEYLAVKNTPYDFRTARPLGKNSDGEFGGYNLNYVIRGSGFRRAAALYHPRSGRGMRVSTDLPGLQLFAGTFGPPEVTGKGGKSYLKSGYCCLEAQYFPNAVNEPDYPSPVQQGGEERVSVTEYQFFAD